jgi:hypothetical protein
VEQKKPQLKYEEFEKLIKCDIVRLTETKTDDTDNIQIQG